MQHYFKTDLFMVILGFKITFEYNGQ